VGEPREVIVAIKAKSIISTLLIVFVFGSLAYMGFQEMNAKRSVSASDPIATVDGVTPDYIVYYFSVGKECSTCEQIASYTQEALEAGFNDALTSGEIQWRTIDMDEPEHEHFAIDYKLYTKSIVLVAVEDGDHGRWENLEKVWDHVYDKPTFIAYIKDSLKAFMDSAP
jgi:hypothetical protein